MHSIRSWMFGIGLVFFGSMPTLANDQYQSCGTLLEGNPPVTCIQLIGTSQKTTLSDTYYFTDVVNKCSTKVSALVDFGDKVSKWELLRGTTRLVCEDRPTCHSAKPYPVSSHCCNRSPSIQSCAFIGKPAKQEANKSPKRDDKSGSAQPATTAPARKSNVKTDVPTNSANAEKPEIKLTRVEKRDLELCFGDKQCIETVMRDAAAREAKDKKDAAEKEARDDKAFQEFVRLESARRQAKIDEAERMQKYHQEQNATVSKQFFEGATQLLQGYVNSQSANGGGVSGATTGTTHKPLTTGSGSGSPQCGGGRYGGCR